MVDFNNEGTVTTPSYEVEKILILEKRENTILAMGFYHKHKGQGAPDEVLEHDLGLIRSKLWELYLQIEAWVLEQGEKKEKESSAKTIRRILENPQATFKDFDSCMRTLSEFLFRNGLTKINVRKTYDKNRVEVENERRRV